MSKRDKDLFKIIKKYYQKSKGRDGIRQLKMSIELGEGLVLNHKRIARIKKKFGLETQIRKKNKHRCFSKKKLEHETCANLVDRNFKDLKPDQIYSIDITTLQYENKKAYLAAVKDIGTKEVVGFDVSNKIDLGMSNRAIDKTLKNLSEEVLEGLVVHSDQGLHFTHFSFRDKLARKGVTQSMSRKGNCLDNAPIESFLDF